MDKSEVISSEERLLAGVYQRIPLVASRGRGAVIYDENGKEYVDCMGGYGVAIVGHCNPKVQEAVRAQVEELITCHGSLYNKVRADFAQKLVSLSPKGLEKVYLANSGAEAVECSLKLARKFTGKRRFVAMMGSYHGKTMGALSTTWTQRYREPFQPLIPEVEFTPFGDLQKASEMIDEETAGVILEPIQGESGVHLPPDDFLRGLREVCDRKSALLIFDEVQTGLGRTGRMWASEHWSVNPDIMCLAKGIGGGLPLAATVAKGDIMSSLKLGDHTSTFGGNPLACAAGLATLDFIVESKLPDKAQRQGELFLAGLKALAGKYRSVREARGLGLMLALELRFDIRDLLLEAVNRGLILLYSGRNTIRLLPPLVITEEQVHLALNILGDLVSKLDASKFTPSS